MRFTRKKSQAQILPDAAAILVKPTARADRFSAQDLIIEATSDIGSRPTRLIMTLAGTVLGIGALVASLGFGQTAANQVSQQFNAAAATQVEISPEEVKTGGGATVAAIQLPWDSAERVERLAGVDAAALISTVTLPTSASITAVPVNDPSVAATAPPALVASSAGLLDALGAKVVQGRMFDAGHDERGDRVVVLGARLAERLSINRLDSQPSIFIDGIAYAVVGIVDEFDRRPDLLDSVIIQTGAARNDFALTAVGSLQVRVAIGAGPQISKQAPIALSPAAPELIKVASPAGQSDLSSNVQSDITLVFIIIGFIVLAAGGVGIANVTMLSVMERTSEIGLRRALGATQRQIASQFILESVVIGSLGGIIGAALAVFAVVGAALVAGWSPVIHPLLPLAGPLLGAMIGLLAGWIPARKAARIGPITALRC